MQIKQQGLGPGIFANSDFTLNCRKTQAKSRANGRQKDEKKKRHDADYVQMKQVKPQEKWILFFSAIHKQITSMFSTCVNSTNRFRKGRVHKIALNRVYICANDPKSGATSSTTPKRLFWLSNHWLLFPSNLSTLTSPWLQNIQHPYSFENWVALHDKMF